MAYTYLINCPDGRRYYGVRYAKGCVPDDLWNNYFTHSKEIKKMIADYGKEKFTFEIRKQFTSDTDARNWENKVLRRLKVDKNFHWVNKTTNVGIPPMFGEDNPSKRQDIREKISKSKMGKKRPDQSKRLLENHHMKNPEVSHKVSETRKRLFEQGLLKSTKGVKRPDITGDKHHFYGQQRQELSKSNLIEYICPHCHKIGKGPAMKRFHFDKCKSI